MTTTSLPHDSAVTPVTLSHLPCFAMYCHVSLPCVFAMLAMYLCHAPTAKFLNIPKMTLQPPYERKIVPSRGKICALPRKIFFPLMPAKPPSPKHFLRIRNYFTPNLNNAWTSSGRVPRASKQKPSQMLLFTTVRIVLPRHQRSHVATYLASSIKLEATPFYGIGKRNLCGILPYQEKRPLLFLIYVQESSHPRYF